MSQVFYSRFRNVGRRGITGWENWLRKGKEEVVRAVWVRRADNSVMVKSFKIDNLAESFIVEWVSQSLRVVLESIFEIQIRKEDGLYSLGVDPKFFLGDRCVCVCRKKQEIWMLWMLGSSDINKSLNLSEKVVPQIPAYHQHGLHLK